MSKRHTGFAGLFLLATLAPGAADADEQTGRSLYLQNCAACHQTEGQGLGHPIPPLAGSRRPRIFTDGEQKRDFVYIDDVIAAILSYARDAWGNAAPPISLALVTAERAKLGNDGFRIPTN